MVITNKMKRYTAKVGAINYKLNSILEKENKKSTKLEFYPEPPKGLIDLTQYPKKIKVESLISSYTWPPAAPKVEMAKTESNVRVDGKVKTKQKRVELNEDLIIDL